MKRLFFLVFILLVFCGFVSPGTAEAADYALSFDGNDYIEVPHHADLNLTQAATVELWFKKSSSIGDWAMFVGKTGDGDETQPWSLYLDEGSDFRGVSFYGGDGSLSSGSDSVQESYENNNEWIHLVTSWENKGDNTLEVNIYIDGTEVEYDTTDTITDLTLGYTNSNPLAIGAAYTVGNQDWWYIGAMDEVRIYSRVLTSTEVTEHYSKIYNNEAGLVAHWNFNEGAGGSVADNSGNGHTGTIYGASWVDGVPFPVDPGPTPPAGSGGMAAFRPEVAISSPQKNDSFSDIVTIKYEASDKNDLYGIVESEWLGLAEAPVSIFYSETSDIRKKKLIAEDLPAFGEYQWSVVDVPDGNTYRLIVKAIDNIDEVGQAVSDAFSIDHVAPIFSVETEPLLTRGEDVTLIVESSKSLIEPPIVTVKQHQFQPVEVLMSIEEGYFKGVYTVMPGYDGTAEISISGEDLSGNIGTAVRSGKTFSINVAPPPSPVVSSPIDKDIVDSEIISVKGQVRPDTAVLLTVNGKDPYEVQPDKEGNFVFKDVRLDPAFANGVNFLSVAARDISGNVGEEASFSVKLNKEPQLSIVSPDEGKLARATSSLIQIGAKDANNDKLVFTIEISGDDGKNWTTLAKEIKQENFRWDTTQFSDGEYLMRAIADDGIAKTQSSIRHFVVLNFLPKISFVEEKSVINKSTFVVEGSVEPTGRRGARTIASVFYSLDNGKRWKEAQPKDGEFNDLVEEFFFTLDGLEEKSYQILVKATDRRGLTGKASKVLIVDFGPPVEPIIDIPLAGRVFSDSDDLNNDRAGVQIKMKGRTEPENKIVIQIGEATFEGLSGPQGNFETIATIREHGENILRVYAVDPAGNRSEKESAVNVFYNNPPDVKFLWPRAGGGLNHTAEIVFEVQDRDLDPIKESLLLYRRIGETKKGLLAKDMEDNKVLWDVAGFPEGRYELILEASDGVSKNFASREFIIDNTPPQASLKPLKNNVFSEEFVLEMTGSATDNLSGVAYIEYAVVSSGEPVENWFKALITSGYKTKQAFFKLKHPYKLQDGFYNVVVRSTDVSGNVSEVSKVQEIIVDTTSPRVGPYTLSMGSFVLFPEGTVFKIPDGSKIQFVISLEKDTEEATMSIGDQSIMLTKELGLWQAELLLDSPGIYPLFITAYDLWENKTEKKKIGEIEVVSKGAVYSLNDRGAREALKDVKLDIFLYDEVGHSWISWQAETYGFSSPVFTNEKGEYELFLPEGKYRVVLEKKGFQKQKITGLDVKNPRFITLDFQLQPQKSFIKRVLEKLGLR